MSQKKKIFGTKEWAVASANCVRGCSHNCRYCFARWEMVHRFKKISDESMWTDEVVNQKKVDKKWKKMDGTIMFPTQHDISPTNLKFCLACLKNILKPGNDVLIVSKPHLVCIETLCKELKDYKDQILFRFTIGAMDDEILWYWEPGAPSRTERLASLVCTQQSGFRTSISMEPVLDWDNVEKNVEIFSPWVTDSIWIGMMNFIDKRVKIETDEDRKQVDLIKSKQVDATFKRVYENLKNNPLIKWKESMKEVLGLELANHPGLDV